MQSSQFRRFLNGTALIASVALVGTSMPRIASAQDTSGTTGAQPGTMTNNNGMDDNDHDWGWVGLLGLAGLLGLRRRDRHTDAYDTTRRTTP